MTDNANTFDGLSEFLNELKDVTRLHQNDRVHIQKQTDSLAKQLKRHALEVNNTLPNNYLSVEKVDPIDPYDHIGFKQDGVQEGVYKKVRLGKYKIDTVLNLQQQKFEQARAQLFTTILDAHINGVRLMLVKHGLGLHSKPFPAMLKSYVNIWLRQMPEVIAFYTAQAKHGGNAAVYVLLKKNQQQKSENRELHRGK